MRASEIAKRVLVSGRCAGLNGKTPEATISAMLAVGSKPGGPFKRVEKGTYALADTPTAPTTKSSEPAAAKRAPARKKTATRKKAKTASSTRKRTAAKRTR